MKKSKAKRQKWVMGNRALRVCAEEGIRLREGLFHNPGEMYSAQLPTWVLGWQRCSWSGAGGQGCGERETD